MRGSRVKTFALKITDVHSRVLNFVITHAGSVLTAPLRFRLGGMQIFFQQGARANSAPRRSRIVPACRMKRRSTRARDERTDFNLIPDARAL